MAAYYIDGDNNPGARTQGIEYLSHKDMATVFYAKGNNYYALEKNRKKLCALTRAKLDFICVPKGKNAVDFAVAMKCGRGPLWMPYAQILIA